MDRKWKSGALGVTPDPALNASDGYATPGNPGGGVPSTKPGAYWYHMVTEELLSIIAAFGIALDKTNVGQVLSALFLGFDSQGILPGGRLTLTTAVPVTAADVAGAATVFYTPHVHDRIKLYDGTRFKWYTFVEVSQALNDATKSPAAAVANTNYDMFVWDNAGVVRCTRGPTWNAGAVAGSDTARGTGANSTELEVFQGRRVNKNAITNGPAARMGLYVGTIRTDGVPQANDTLAKRHVWNMYNRTNRPMRVLDTTDTWTYSVNAFRQANGSTANQLDVVRGLDEDGVTVLAKGSCSNSTATSRPARSAVGIDSTTVASGVIGLNDNAGIQTEGVGFYHGLPGLGRHILTWLEFGAGADVQTWWGDNAGTFTQNGISGEVMA